MRTKDEVLNDLRVMLRDVFNANAAGESRARLSRAHGYVDGYMRAVLETGFASKRELLDLVAGERARAGGPAMREMGDIQENDALVA